MDEIVELFGVWAVLWKKTGTEEFDGKCMQPSGMWESEVKGDFDIDPNYRTVGCWDRYGCLMMVESKVLDGVVRSWNKLNDSAAPPHPSHIHHSNLHNPFKCRSCDDNGAGLDADFSLNVATMTLVASTDPCRAL